jgi:hemoglobin
MTLCAKYGGADAVASVIKNQVIGEIAADCRINAFFTTLSQAGLTRVSDCLAIQAQQLFACPGVTYAGASATNSLPCRSMSEAHAGLGVSEGDFMALIEDVAAGLGSAGVEEADIAAAAPALMGLKPDIVEDTATEPTRAGCDAGAGDGG